MRNAIIPILAIILTSCCTTQEVIVYKTKDSVAIHVDTTWKTYYNPADSLKLTDNLSAYMDSLGRCRIKDSQGTVESGKIIVKYIVRNDSIFIQANTKPYEIKIAELTTTIERFKEVYESYTKQGVTVKKRKWLSFWESWACIGILGLIVGRFIFKKMGLKLALTITPPFITITK